MTLPSYARAQSATYIAVVKTAQRVAERLDAGNVVCLFADGGWKYLSTHLWTTSYEDLPQDIEDKIWW